MSYHTRMAPLMRAVLLALLMAPARPAPTSAAAQRAWLSIPRVGVRAPVRVVPTPGGAQQQTVHQTQVVTNTVNQKVITITKGVTVTKLKPIEVDRVIKVPVYITRVVYPTQTAVPYPTETPTDQAAYPTPTDTPQAYMPPLYP